jgi:hypothetical protein
MKNEGKYPGMTVNERLYASGNLLDFERAVKKRDVEKVVEILKHLELENISIELILKQLGLK